MKLAILKETATQEARVAATPDIVKKYVHAGFNVAVQSDAGLAAGFDNAAYKNAGAMITDNIAQTLQDAELILAVQAPAKDIIAQIMPNATLVALCDPHRQRDLLPALNARNITCFALEFVPRTSRAQTMDVLSSQANLAGYRAVIEAAQHYGHAFPMFMTAAGTIAPARVFVMGAGVAGLQAIATAKRLGAIVSATDVRAASKEQVESLGANFIMVEDDEVKQAETSGGYAREMSDAYKVKQAALIAEHITKQDIVICTALIPGKPAPTLVSAEMLKTMKRGSVLVDLAASNGGNCPATVPGEVTQQGGVTLVGYTNMAARIASDASALFAKNVYNFLELFIDHKGPIIDINWQDDIIAATALTHEGRTIHPLFTEANA